MPKLPIISGDEGIAALQKLGYRVKRIKGSHAWLACPGKAPQTFIYSVVIKKYF